MTRGGVVPIDIDVPESPGWWLDRLARKLLDKKRQDRLELLDAWFRGDPPPERVEVAPAQRRAVESLMKRCRSNFAELVVEAPRERMTPVGVRTSADGDETGDAEAWRIWQRAGLDVESAEVHRTGLAMGDAYVLVGQVDAVSGVPTITAEDPRQVVTEHDPTHQRRIRAGLKMFHDDVTETTYAYLYLPGKVYVARMTSKSAALRWSAGSFEWDESKGGADGQTLPGGLMPLIRFRNARGVGEFEPHLDLLGRINFMILQRVVIAVFQAFKQRAIKGLPQKDKKGVAIDYSNVFAADPGALWAVPATNDDGGKVEFWESGQVDLTPILSSVKADVTHLAAVTRTPMHVLDPGGENQSAEGAALAREGLVFKTEDRITRWTDGWSEVMAAAFRWMSAEAEGAEAAALEQRADLNKLRIMWAPAERLSLSEKADAATKAQASGIPWRTRAVSIWGFSPDDIPRMESERADDQLLVEQVAVAQQAAIAQATPAAPAAPAFSG